MDVHFFDDEKLNGISDPVFSSLIDFIRHVWDPGLTKERYLAERSRMFSENPYAKSGGLPLGLIVDGERVVAHCVSHPCRLWSNGKESPLYWNAGLYILEEYRGKGLGLVLPKLQADKLPTITAFFVVEQQLRTHTKLGYTILGKIPEYIKILNVRNFTTRLDIRNVKQIPGSIRTVMGPPGSFLRKPMHWGLALGYGIYKLFRNVSMTGRSRSDENIRFVDAYDERLDKLWDKVKYSLLCAQVRNSAYMNWQFKTEKGWIKIIAEHGEGIVGYALCAGKVFTEEDKLSGLKVLSIIDILWDFEKPVICIHMLNWIEDFAKREGYDALICSINHKEARRILLKKAFIKLPGTAYFIFHTHDKSLGLSPDMNDWFITRGDADAAGSLGPA